MAYDEYLADRMRKSLKDQKARFEEKKMMGGLCFMVDGKMCCGVLFDKKRETDVVMARIGEEASEKAMKKKGCHPMDFTGRPMRAYVFVSPEGYDRDKDLDYWIDLCLQFNPLAKASKKRKPKK